MGKRVLLITLALVFFLSGEILAQLKIGVSAPMTGTIPVVGASTKRAAEFAVEEVNAKGGLRIGGKMVKVQLFVEDDENKPEVGAAVAQKLINQYGVHGIIGSQASKVAIAVAAVAESFGVPMISPWSTNPKTTAGKRFVFRACFIDDFQGWVMAKFSKDELKAKTAGVLYDVASDYNKGIAEFFKKSFEELGGKVVSFETYTTGDKDFSAQLTKIKGANPDVLFLPNYYDEIPLQTQQAKRLGVKSIIIGGDGWDVPEILKLGGKDLEGTYFSTHYSIDTATAVTKEFVNKFKARYGELPDTPAALTYDAFRIMFLAAERAGKLDRKAIRDQIARIRRYEGVTGTMQFREGSGDPLKSAVIIKIANGRFNYLKTVEPIMK